MPKCEKPATELLSWEAANMLWRMGTPLEFRWVNDPRDHWYSLTPFHHSFTRIHDKPDDLDLRVKQE